MKVFNMDSWHKQLGYKARKSATKHELESRKRKDVWKHEIQRTLFL